MSLINKILGIIITIKGTEAITKAAFEKSRTNLQRENLDGIVESSRKNPFNLKNTK